jgi:hypothetical protein
MADELVIQQTAPETNTATEVQIQAAPEMDLAAHMAIALNGGIPPQEAQAQVAADATLGAGAATAAVDPTVNDPFGLFKEKFGYETPDAAIKEIEELRAFKAQPRTPEFTVPDTESAAILRALAAGKREEVWKALDHEMRIERLLGADVNKDSAVDIVKMGMALKYKDLSPDEINYKFNKQFAVPPEPKQTDLEDDVDFQNRLASWKDQVMDKQMELMIEAKMVKPELQNAKGKLEIPDIETPVDEGYVQYQKMLEENARLDAETKAAYQKITPKAVETKLNFKDEANKIAFEFQYEPDVEGFKKAVEIASNSDLFWQTFTNPDGTPNREKFLDMIYYATNKEKVLLAALNQSKNATIKASLPDNSQGGLIRQIPQSQEPNELDRQMQMALAGYGPRR